MTDFLKPENIQLLWEVITDEKIFQQKPKEFIDHFQKIFNQNLHPFFEMEKVNQPVLPESLVIFNKKYISFMIDTAIRLEKTYKTQPTNLVSSLPKINQEKREAITYEEIQEERKTQFEKDLQRRQQEFQNSVSLKVPPKPEFSDVSKEEKPPISELERRIQQTIAERNFDLEHHAPSVKINNWLSSQETSVKKEKTTLNMTIAQDRQQQYTQPQGKKYIKIEEPILKDDLIQPIFLDESVNVRSNQNKHIQWRENLEENYYLPDNSSNIPTLFSKIKKIPETKEGDLIVEERVPSTRELQEEIYSLNQKMSEMGKMIEEIKKMREKEEGLL